jgi:hypothetical protein
MVGKIGIKIVTEIFQIFGDTIRTSGNFKDKRIAKQQIC